MQMFSEHDIRKALERLLNGDETQEDRKTLKNLLENGNLTVAYGTRSVAIGGSVSNTQINIGDKTILTLDGVDAENINQVLSSLTAKHWGALPLRPAMLLGREQSLEDLRSRLRSFLSPRAATSGQRLAAVRGWAGVGKTALVAALAYDAEVQGLFPDGVLWTSLGREPNVLSELTTWGRALGADLARARDEREASSRLAAMLRNKRMLLIVDDVWEAAHAEPFRVGGEGCALIITTRSDEIARRLVATPADVHRLDVLSLDDSYELLSRLAPEVVSKHPQECRDLTVEVGLLPLALQVAGRLLHAESHFGWGVIELLDKLRHGRALLEAQAPSDRADVVMGTTPTVAVLLEKSTERLPSEERDCFAFLGVFAPEPASFNLEALKAVWQIDDPRETVRTLVNRGLLEPAAIGGRYGMHALIATHARSLLTEDGPGMPTLREAHCRHSTYYYAALRRADELYRQEDGNFKDGLRLFDLDAENIRRGQAWAAHHTDIDEAAAKLCSRYPLSGGNLLPLRLHPRECLAWAESGLKAAQRLNDRAMEALNWGLLGLACVTVGQARRAVLAYEKEIAIAQELGDRHLEGGTYSNLGYAYHALGEVPRAIEYYKLAIEILCSLGDHDAESDVYSNLAIAYGDLDRTAEALEIHRRALDYYRRKGRRRGEAVTLGNMANAHASLGRTELAIQLIDEALTIFREIGFLTAEGEALHTLGCLYSKRGEMPRAMEYLEQGLDIIRETENRGSEAGTLGAIGKIYGELGENERSLDYLQQQLTVAREVDDATSEANALAGMGYIHRKVGDLPIAVEFYRAARAVARRVKNYNQEITILCGLGELYESKSDFSEAREIYRQQLQIARDNNHHDAEIHAVDHLAKTHATECDVRQAIGVYEHQLKLCQATGNWHGEARIHWLMSQMLEKCGDHAGAVVSAQSAIRILESFNDYDCASKVRRQLSVWNGTADDPSLGFPSVS